MGAGHYLPSIEISYSSGFETSPNITEYKFGDGYSQSVGNGINHMPENISVSYVNRSQRDMETLIAFFRARGGTDYFMFIPPPYKTASGVSNPPRKFKCTKWSKNPSSGVTWNINCTFEEVFNI